MKVLSITAAAVGLASGAPVTAMGLPDWQRVVAQINGNPKSTWTVKVLADRDQTRMTDLDGYKPHPRNYELPRYS